MAFDIEGARKAGYSETEIADHLATTNKFDAAGARKSGYSDADIVSHLSAVAAAPAPSRMSQFMEGLKNPVGKNAVMGAVEHAANIGATIMQPFQAGADKLGEMIGGKPVANTNAATRAGIKGGVDEIGVDRNSMGYKSAGLATEIAATAGVGGALGGVARLAGAAPKVVSALTSAGFTTGAKVAPGALARVGDMALRSGAGAVTGAASTGLINPDDAGMGAVVGGVLPPALKVAGAVLAPVGKVVAGAAKSAFMPRDVAGAQAMVKALDMTAPELRALMAASKSAPQDIVPGSKLTFAQALQLQGANTPGIKMLERTVAGGPGGDVLLKRYEDQGAARLEALRAQGAQTYQGAAASEASQAGDKIGAVLRTQAGDDQATTRAAWEALHGRASREGVALQLPLDQMNAAMGPLGPGRVGAGKDARAILTEAQNIGTDVAPAVMPTTERIGAAASDKTLGQAVRAAGIHPDELSGQMAGEVRWLGQSLKGGRGLVNKSGQSLDRLAEKMHEAGYLHEPDPHELMQKLAEEAQGAPVFSRSANAERMAYERSGGDMPARAGMVLPKSVPFDQFQRLRSSSGELAAGANMGPTEGAVLGKFEQALAGRADQAAAGKLLPGEVMPSGFADEYNTARGMTRADKMRYEQGNNIGSILRRPIGQDYALTGNEITNKLWHGGAGLAGDVSNLKNTLSQNNYEPTLNALRGHVMTDAASKTTASGQFGAALPKYVEQRLPGLQEAMAPDQLKALTSVAADIRNSEAAAAIPGLRGSDTQAKITRALDAGLLDSPAAKMVAKFASLKGMGGETIRAKLADMMVQNKGKTLAELLADPKKAAEALEAYRRYQSTPLQGMLADALVPSIYRGAPRTATSRGNQ